VGVCRKTVGEFEEGTGPQSYRENRQVVCSTIKERRSYCFFNTATATRQEKKWMIHKLITVGRQGRGALHWSWRWKKRRSYAVSKKLWPTSVKRATTCRLFGELDQGFKRKKGHSHMQEGEHHFFEKDSASGIKSRLGKEGTRRKGRVRSRRLTPETPVPRKDSV